MNAINDQVILSDSMQLQVLNTSVLPEQWA